MSLKWPFVFKILILILISCIIILSYIYNNNNDVPNLNNHNLIIDNNNNNDVPKLNGNNNNNIIDDNNTSITPSPYPINEKCDILKYPEDNHKNDDRNLLILVLGGVLAFLLLYSFKCYLVPSDFSNEINGILRNTENEFNKIDFLLNETSNLINSNNDNNNNARLMELVRADILDAQNGNIGPVVSVVNGVEIVTMQVSPNNLPGNSN